MKRKSNLWAVVLITATAGVSNAVLLAEWNFDGQNLTNSGATAGIHDGATVGVPVFTTDTPSGSGYALDLSSASEYMLVPDSSTNDLAYTDTFDTATNFTFSMWMKSTDGSWTQWSEIAGKGNESSSQSGSDEGWALRMRNLGTHGADGLRVDFYGVGTTVKDASPYEDTLDQLWHLLTFTYESSSTTLTLYIDGEPIATNATAAAMNPTLGNALAIGARYDGSRGENMLVDTVQFYDEVLDSSEVAAMYSDQIEFLVEPDALSLLLGAPATACTGSVAVSYVTSGSGGLDVDVSIQEESHAGAFSVLTAVPLVLPDPSPSNAVLEVEFDNSVAGLANGESATGLVAIAWNPTGETTTNTVVVPFSVTYVTPIQDPVLVQVDFGATPGASGGAINGTTTEGGTTWNGVEPGESGANLPAGGQYIAENLVDSMNQASVVGLTLDWFSGAGLDFSRAWDLHPGDRDGDYIAIKGDTSNVYNVATFTGLKSGGEYHVTVWTQTSTDFRINGGAVQVVEGSQNTNTVNMAASRTFSNVFASVAGELVVDWGHITTDRGANAWASMTAMSIEAVSAATVGDVSIVSVDGGLEVELTFATSSGALYGIDARDSLSTGGWTAKTNGISGNGGEVTVTVPVSADAEFYRAYIQE